MNDVPICETVHDIHIPSKQEVALFVSFLDLTVDKISTKFRRIVVVDKSSYSTICRIDVQSYLTKCRVDKMVFDQMTCTRKN